MLKVVDFLRLNKEKKMTVAVWFWSCYYRMAVKLIPAKRLRRYYGLEGVESTYEETKEHYDYTWKLGFHLERVGEHTPWETKCLVRALTAQRLMTRRHITSTLYLGVGLKENKMIAHAWIRCGKRFVTGGDGTGYSVVAKFSK